MKESPSATTSRSSKAMVCDATNLPSAVVTVTSLAPPHLPFRQPAWTLTPRTSLSHGHGPDDISSAPESSTALRDIHWQVLPASSGADVNWIVTS